MSKKFVITSSKSEIENHLNQQYQNQKLANFKAILSDIGLSTTDDYKIMQLQQGLTKEEKKELINSIEFLKSNYVTGMGMDLGNAYYYEYRFIENDSYNRTRLLG